MSLPQTRRITFDELVRVRRRTARCWHPSPALITAVTWRPSRERRDAGHVLVDHGEVIVPSLFTSRSTSWMVPTGEALRSYMLNTNSQTKFGFTLQIWPAGVRNVLTAATRIVGIRLPRRPARHAACPARCPAPSTQRSARHRRPCSSAPPCPTPVAGSTAGSCAARQLGLHVGRLARQDVPRHGHLVVIALEHDVAVVLIGRQRPDGIATRARVHQVVAQLGPSTFSFTVDLGRRERHDHDGSTATTVIFTAPVSASSW